MSIISIVYLAVFASGSGLLIYIIKSKWFGLLAEKEWRKTWTVPVSVFSQFFLVLLLLDETGLLLQEWGLSTGFFGVIRKILEFPGISQLVLLANFGLVIPAVYTLTSGLLNQVHDENKSRITGWDTFELYRKRYSFFVSLLVLTISLLFFLLQCLVFNEFDLSDSLSPVSLAFVILIMFSGPLTVFFFILKKEREISKAYNPYRNQPWFEKNMVFVILLICFISLAQTMITKVLLLLSLAEWAQPAIYKLLRIIRSGVNKSVSTIKTLSYESIVKGLSASSLWHKWNFIFLTTSFLSLLLLFQSHSGPYPPSGSSFPKTETISTLYMVYMLLFLAIGTRNKLIRLKSVAWTSLTIFILYITPVLFPGWYFPSIDPPGFSPLETISVLSNTLVSSLFFFAIHLLTSVIFLGLYYAATLKNNFVETGYRNKTDFKKYFFLKVSLSDIFPLTMFSAIWLIFRTSTAYSLALANNNENLAGVNIALSMIVLLLFVNGARSKRRRITEIRDETLEFGGEDLVTELGCNFKLINSFREWNTKKTSLRGYFFFSLPALILFLILILIDILARI